MKALYRAALCMAALLCVTRVPAASISVTLEPGQQKTWSFNQPIKRVATGNSDVAGINVVPPRGIIITGKATGTTMVTIWPKGSDTPIG